MDESPTKPEGFILTKQKTPDQATEHFQIARPLNFKTGVWKFINFFVRHKHHKHKVNSNFLDEDPLRNDYGLCLLSDDLGDQSPFDRELLMENDEVKGETNPSDDTKVKSDARRFFHKMSLEGLMKLFADLHRKKRARELAKSNPSRSEEMTSAMTFDQPCCLERVERYIRCSSPISLKRETAASRASSATVLETGYIRVSNMATPANSPQKIAHKRLDPTDEDSETLNLLECVRTKLADYLHTKESVTYLRATYNEAIICEEFIDDDLSKRMVTNLDDDSLKYDVSCDDIPSLKNNSQNTLNEIHDTTSKENVCYKQNPNVEDEYLELNQSFLEEAINSEIIPPLISSDGNDSQKSVEIDTEVDSNMEEVSVCKAYSYHDSENLEEKRLVQYQLLHVIPFTEQIENPVQYLTTQEVNPKMFASQELNVAPNINEFSLGEINAEENIIPDSPQIDSTDEQTVADPFEVSSNSTINSIKKCDRGVDAFKKDVEFCTIGVGSQVLLQDIEPESDSNIEIFGEDLIIFEDTTLPLEATKERKFDVVAVQRGSQDIMHEEEPYLISDKTDETSIEDDSNIISKEDDLVYVIEKERKDQVFFKETELLFVCKYMDDILNDNDTKKFENTKRLESQVSVDEASQTKDVIVLEKHPTPRTSNDRFQLEVMIQQEIANNFLSILENKELTTEDQVRTSREILNAFDTDPTVEEARYTPTEESFMNTVHFSDSITSDLLSNLDLIALSRKDDMGNIGSDSGIYVSKNASRITTLTYRDSQTLYQPIADKPVKIEGETTQEVEVEVSNYVFDKEMKGETCNEIKVTQQAEENKILEWKEDDINTEESSAYEDTMIEEKTEILGNEEEVAEDKEQIQECNVNDGQITQNESETQTLQEKIVDVQRSQEDQINYESQSMKGRTSNEHQEVEKKIIVEDIVEDMKTLASDKPELAYAQAEEDIKTMIKELLYETEDIKEAIIASATNGQCSSSLNICRRILEDMINNITTEDVPSKVEVMKVQEDEAGDTFAEVADILNSIVDKVCHIADTKVHKNVVSVNYCLVHNHFHERNAKKHESRIVRANKNFRTFYKIKGNSCCSQSGPRVTVVNLSSTSQRFLRSEEKLTNRIRRSAALLMALYEEMRDYSYYSCTSNILCDLYESMSRYERYLNKQKMPRNLECRPGNFVANADGNIFVNYQTKTETDSNKKDTPEIAEIKSVLDEQTPNTSSNNGESSSMVASSSYSKSLTLSTSSSSIYSDSDEEIPLSEILPNLKYTYYSQEEINTDEELKQIENNVEVNNGKDLGLDVMLIDSLSNDSIRTDVAINDTENFMKSAESLKRNA